MNRKTGRPAGIAGDAADDVDAGSTPFVAPLRFTTEDLPPEKQFAAWQDRVSSMTEVRLPEDARLEDGFIAEDTLYALGHIALLSQNADPFEIERPPAKLRVADADHWVLSLHRQGKTIVEADGRILEEAPGTFTLRTLTRPFRGKVPVASKVLSLHVPRDLFPEIAVAIDSFNNTHISGGLTAVLADYLLSLERNLPTILEADRPRIAQLTKTMIAGCLAPSPDSVLAAQHGIAATLLERATRHIQHNLRSPTLSPTELCRVLNVSRSQLYRLFEPHGGVAWMIRKKRLAAAHAALANVREHRRIHEIAYEFGFGSADEFSRAFRKEFGYSPREVHERGSLRTVISL